MMIFGWRNKTALLLAATLMTITACSEASNPVAEKDEADTATLRRAIAQKIIIDLRYFCEEAPQEGPCKKPMTTLPPQLARVISDTGIGGVILFAENLVDTAQMIQLNHDLQQAAVNGLSGQPLLLTLDQEGGRVARIPRHLATSLSGNMAIGATFAEHGLMFAEKTGDILGGELASLGFNVNHAPTVDVNVNPENPVINVRSFGENPLHVAQLGLAQLKAMQRQGVIGTLKHFPGHGDTAVDSHTGLPRVDHDRNTIEEVDLLPFRYAIEQGEVDMIMTAHIQYPQLDSSEIENTAGEKMLRPATLSRAILTDLLRKDMGFEGVIVTDAMDMAGISAFFEPTQAVIETFRAGTDLVLMPVRLHTPEELERLPALISQLLEAVEAGKLNAAEVIASAKRIHKLKQKYLRNPLQPSAEQIARAEGILRHPDHLATEQALADAALTQIGENNVNTPLTAQTMHLLMPDRSKCLAMEQALSRHLPDLTVSCTSLQSYLPQQQRQAMDNADILLVASITPAQSAVERGGMEDMQQVEAEAIAHQDQQALLPQQIDAAKRAGKEVIFVSLRAPYEIRTLAEKADLVLATYGYNTHVVPDTQANPQVHGPAFESLARYLAGKIDARGQLPVTIE
ncbi:glycoside hydrolase family 3 N-terminal domain-containing protein [Lacimicrobium sp. SS2-24]|uniref:glycoside hydrolase family 3 protein n=1 Tax=Lacimicrobium sp. SS2-24 TaxID=2005569 RepID=UPI001FEECA7C|nr:glycoside hydrolase family 3 N-terminal domain-containing protein [Lacimicrobium sp. SS2-24]